MAKGEAYDEFVEKFEPKKTTDDCYTPEPVYEAVAGYVADRWGVDRSDMVRPFWPGGDYEALDYPEGCVVVDNPPFSILARIKRFYKARGVRFFLFCPGLTALGSWDGDNTVIISDNDVTYENGAVVRTAFVTNLESDYCLECDPDLRRLVQEAADEFARRGKKTLPKYTYPYALLTAARAQWLTKHGSTFRVPKGRAVRVNRLDSQDGKSVFGGGVAALLLCDRRTCSRRTCSRRTCSRRTCSRHRLAALGQGGGHLLGARRVAMATSRIMPTGDPRLPKERRFAKLSVFWYS